MRATLIDASGHTIEIGDLFEGDFVLVDAAGQQLAHGTVAGPHAFERQDDSSLVLHGLDLVPTFTAKEVTASIRCPVESNNQWPSLEDVVCVTEEQVFAPSSPRFGWPDPNRGGARKRRRGRR